MDFQGIYIAFYPKFMAFDLKLAFDFWELGWILENNFHFT